MKRNRVALIAALILIFLMGKGPLSREIKIYQILRGMNNKYRDDTFTYVGYTGGQLGSPGSGFYVVKSEKYPDKPIWVTYSNGCTDTYLSAKYENQTREYFQKQMEGAFGEACYVDYNYSPSSVGFSSPLNGDISFEEYVATRSFCIHFHVLVNGIPEDGEETLERVQSALSESSPICDILFVDEPGLVLDAEAYTRVVDNRECALSLVLNKATPDSYNWWEWGVGTLYRNELEELITQRLGQVFDADYYVEADPRNYGSYSSIPSFEEYIVQPGNGAGFTAIVRYSPTNKKKVRSLMREAFSNVVVDGRIFFVEDSSLSLDEDTLKKYNLLELRAISLFMGKPDLNTYDFSWRDSDWNIIGG